MKSNPHLNPYLLLGVSRAATGDQIRKAYIAKALQHHPDKGGDEEMMKNLVQAYNTLRTGNIDLNDEDFDDYSEGPTFSGLALSTGFKQSDIYRELLKDWQKEFLTINLKDNFQEAFGPVIERAIKNLEFNIEMAQFFKDENFEMNDIEASSDEFLENLDSAIKSRDIDCLLAALSEIRPKNASSAEVLIKSYESRIDFMDPHGQVIKKIVHAAVYKARGEVLKSLDCLKNALIILPDESTAKAVGTMMQDQTYAITSMENICQEFKQLREDIRSRNMNLKKYKFFGFDDIPLKENYIKRLQPTPYTRCLKKYEASIAERLAMTPLEAAFGYIDMTMATSDGASYTGSLVFAAAYFLKAMQFSDDLPLIYACRKIIIRLSLNVLHLCTTYLDPFMKLHLIRMIFSILMQAEILLSSCLKVVNSNMDHPVESVEKVDVDIVTNLLDNLTESARVSPFFLLPSTLVCDMLFFGLIGTRFLEFYLPHIVDIGHDEKASYDDIQLLAQYYLFEGTWRRWIGEKDFTVERERCLSAFLKYYGLKSYEVEDLLNLNLVQRNQGWLHEAKVELKFSSGASYAKVLGVEFNLENGDVRLLLEESKGGNGLFDWNDVNEVFGNGIRETFFTLDHPSVLYPNHPFQEMKYFPESLKDTNYLKTLLHADYLLKMITTGVEVNTEFPFEQRPAKEGFLKRLPPELRKALDVIEDQKNTQTFHRMHRFWIENEAITYDIKEEKNKFTFLMGDAKMKVLKHILERNEKGEIVDSKTDNEYESPEALFAKNFTEHYDQIGEYFPEMLRLKELIKLGTVFHIIRSNFQAWKEKSQTFKVPPNYKSLEDSRSQIQFPLATNATLVESKLDECFKENGVTRAQVSTSELNRVRGEIINALRNNEVRLLQDYTDQFAKIYEIPAGPLKSYVSEWLYASNSRGLGDFIAKQQEDRERAKLVKICSAIERTGVNTKEHPDMQGWPETNGCVWVPAAFGFKNESKSRMVYGGVMLYPQLQQGSLQIPQTGCKLTSLLSSPVVHQASSNSGANNQTNTKSESNKLSPIENFIFKHEVIPSRLDKTATWHKPNANSGATIGVGYDVKTRKQSEVRDRLISIGVEAHIAEAQSKGAMLSGSAASQFVKNNNNFKLTDPQQYALFKQTFLEQQKELSRLTEKHWKIDYNDPKLSQNVRTVLLDMKYRGDLFMKRKDVQESVEHARNTGDNSRLVNNLKQQLKSLEAKFERENKKPDPGVITRFHDRIKLLEQK